jgi:glycosyltransferase involved in cell wall biosynthesis
MITIGYSTRKENPQFKEYLKKTAGHPKVQIIEKINNGEKSLTDVYNQILKEAENDIVVFSHDDIYFEKNGWVRRILTHFENSDYGILGVAGSTYIPKSGQWWEDRSKMVGIVNHEHNGKKWESKYSDNLGKDLQSVIIVDGLFFAVNKKKIKETFNESVKGFHLYDVDFCFQNVMKGVKVGVMFDIRITHKSIGMVNEEWEKNRVQFSETYSNVLPQKIKKTKDDKLKILIGCLSFTNLTGSELYVFELSKGLVKSGHDVTVIANQTGDILEKLANKHGIKVLSFKNPPGFKMGDGVWSFQTPQGVVKAEKDKLYKTSEVNYDIMLVQHTPIVESLCAMYPNTDKISIIHSEVISLENPYIHESIKKYICIRPEIQEHIINNFSIDREKTKVIYNPIDEEKFNLNDINDKNYVLFVGTIDYLRKQTLFDLMEYSKTINKEFWIVGENKTDYLNDLLANNHVKHFKPTNDIESFTKNCSETGGILLGRTTIEGWMCGKPGWIYNVDSNGDIINKKIHNVPNDLDKYISKNVSKEIINEIINII